VKVRVQFITLMALRSVRIEAVEMKI